jgi:hypothetical protein
MVPQVTSNRADHEDEVVPTTTSEDPTSTEESKTPAAPAPADVEQQGHETAWAAMIVLGTALLLVSTGLGVAAALHIDLAAWLLGGVLFVLVIVAVAHVLDSAMLQTLTRDELRA